MRLEIFGEADSKRWDDIVNSSVNGTLYHTWTWLKIVEKHSMSKLFPMVFFDSDDDMPFGAIPLFHMNKFGIKMIFSPPPWCYISLGPVIINKRYKQHKFELAYLDFQAYMDRFIKKLGVNYTSIGTSTGLLDIRPFLWAGYKVTPFYTYKIDLSQGEETIWNNLRKNTRRDINIAKKKGINIMEQTDEISIDYVYSVTSSRYAHRHQRFPVHRSYLTDTFQQFGHTYIKTYVALYQGQIVTALSCTIYKNTCCAWIGGTRTEESGLEANKLLYWDIITRMINNKYKYFELMGANTRHLCEFKSIFGPEISIYFGMNKSDTLGSLAEKLYLLMKKSYF